MKDNVSGCFFSEHSVFIFPFHNVRSFLFGRVYRLCCFQLKC